MLNLLLSSRVMLQSDVTVSRIRLDCGLDCFLHACSRKSDKSCISSWLFHWNRVRPLFDGIISWNGIFTGSFGRSGPDRWTRTYPDISVQRWPWMWLNWTKLMFRKYILLLLFGVQCLKHNSDGTILQIGKATKGNGPKQKVKNIFKPSHFNSKK